MKTSSSAPRRHRRGGRRIPSGPRRDADPGPRGGRLRQRPARVPRAPAAVRDPLPAPRPGPRVRRRGVAVGGGVPTSRPATASASSRCRVRRVPVVRGGRFSLCPRLEHLGVARPGGFAELASSRAPTPSRCPVVPDARRRCSTASPSRCTPSTARACRSGRTSPSRRRRHRARGRAGRRAAGAARVTVTGRRPEPRGGPRARCRRRRERLLGERRRPRAPTSSSKPPAAPMRSTALGVAAAAPSWDSSARHSTARFRLPARHGERTDHACLELRHLGRQDEYAAAIELVAAGRVRLAPAVTHRVALETSPRLRPRRRRAERGRQGAGRTSRDGSAPCSASTSASAARGPRSWTDAGGSPRPGRGSPCPHGPRSAAPNRTRPPGSPRRRGDGRGGRGAPGVAIARSASRPWGGARAGRRRPRPRLAGPPVRPRHPRGPQRRALCGRLGLRTTAEPRSRPPEAAAVARQERRGSPARRSPWTRPATSWRPVAARHGRDHRLRVLPRREACPRRAAGARPWPWPATSRRSGPGGSGSGGPVLTGLLRHVRRHRRRRRVRPGDACVLFGRPDHRRGPRRPAADMLGLVASPTRGGRARRRLDRDRRLGARGRAGCSARRPASPTARAPPGRSTPGPGACCSSRTWPASGAACAIPAARGVLSG